jgi:hypothetical protein
MTAVEHLPVIARFEVRRRSYNWAISVPLKLQTAAATLGGAHCAPQNLLRARLKERISGARTKQRVATVSWDDVVAKVNKEQKCI